MCGNNIQVGVGGCFRVSLGKGTGHWGVGLLAGIYGWETLWDFNTGRSAGRVKRLFRSVVGRSLFRSLRKRGGILKLVALRTGPRFTWKGSCGVWGNWCSGGFHG